MTMYILDAETMTEGIDTIEGIDNDDCERMADDKYGDTDLYVWSYTRP